MATMINRHPMHLRLTDWAYWVTAKGEGKVGAMGYSKCTLADWRSGDGYDGSARSTVPVNAIQCRRTHDAIQACEPWQREVLTWYYVQALTLRTIAQRLTVASPETAQRRVLASLDAVESVIHTAA
ncbi:MAG: hypothetical protein IOD11_20515 [Rhodocyclaceae bacterium]|nr:hypothetical protein [Rhodocyclaceae bacterium]MCA3097473.1 hypothetical protein [Rhodocyclaceae bacterium]MCA3120513.1 hypothetical protein [Rhodocyclaceae bacterium]